MGERVILFDRDLQVEAYRFNGIMQKFPNHFHTYYVVGFIEQGKRKLSSRNQDYELITGDVLFFNPYDNHACEQMDNQALHYCCINIMTHTMKQLTKELMGSEYLPKFKNNVVRNSELTELLQKLHRLIMDEEVGDQKTEAFNVLMKQLIEQFMEFPVEETVGDVDSKLLFIGDFIEKHFKEKIALDDLAEMVGLNKYTFVRSFTRLKGITPYRYLQTVRINEAKKMLELGASSSDAALECGFVDQSHFSNFFMEFMGLTPGQYQRIFTE